MLLDQPKRKKYHFILKKKEEKVSNNIKFLYKNYTNIHQFFNLIHHEYQFILNNFIINQLIIKFIN